MKNATRKWNETGRGWNKIPLTCQCPLAWLPGLLCPRRVSLDGEGGGLAFQLGRKRVVAQPVAVDPRLAGELGRHHEYAEMALARAGRALVARMHMRLVDHVEPGRPERDHQFLSDCRRDRHSGSCPLRKAYPDIFVIHGRTASTRGARGRRPTRHMPPRGGNPSLPHRLQSKKPGASESD